MRPADRPALVSAPRTGDWVFVHPQEEAAPREARGLAGVVESVSSGVATVRFRGETGAFSLEVETVLLHAERRRRDRAPAQWPGRELVPARI